MKLLDRLAGRLGYIRADQALQGSIALKSENRAHVVLQIDDLELSGEVDYLRTTVP